jgi:hypothetical protein
MSLHKLRHYIYNRADVHCNQKYADILPYSFHLDCVEKQGLKFKKLLDREELVVVTAGLICHEAIEDFRMSYNDVLAVCDNFYDVDERNYNYIEDFGKKVADIVYCVTDEKGKTRKERKSDKYYKELSENKLAVFVKLADISANTLFSKLTGSSMYDKYKSEFASFKEKCYVEEYKEFFDYLESI